MKIGIPFIPALIIPTIVINSLQPYKQYTTPASKSQEAGPPLQRTPPIPILVPPGRGGRLTSSNRFNGPGAGFSKVDTPG